MEAVVSMKESSNAEKRSSFFSQNFGLMIEYYRKQVKGLSLKQLEDISGVSASYIHRIEKGDRNSTSMGLVLQLTEALEIPDSVLFSIISQKAIKNEQVTLSDLLLQSDYTLQGNRLNNKEKGSLLQIIEFLSECQWSVSSKIHDLYQLSDLVEQFKVVRSESSL